MLTLASLLGCNPPTRGPGTHPVGLRSVSVSECRPGVEVALWYPAAQGTKERAVRYTRLAHGRVARDARPATATRGLWLLSHGQRSGPFDLSWLGESLAAEGFVAASVRHAGFDDESWNEATSTRPWLRAADASCVLTAILNDSNLPHISDGAVAVVGHSAGAYTALALLGARLHAQALGRGDASGAFEALASFRDARVRAGVLLAPGFADLLDMESLQSIPHPVLVAAAMDDDVTPVSQHALPIAAALAAGQLLRIPNAGHYVFKPLCGRFATWRAPLVCRDAPSVDRSSVHREVVQRCSALLR